MKNIRKPIAISIGLILLVLLPKAGISNYTIHLFIITLLNITCTVGLWLIVETGQLSIGHAAFMCIGAYASTLFVLKLGLPFWPSFFGAGLVSGFIAVCLGIPSLRVKGAYFAILTFGFGEALRLIISALVNPFGGVNGIVGIPNPKGFGSVASYYYFSLVLALLSIYLTKRLHSSHWGLNFRFIGHEDSLAESVGIDIMWHKVIAFMLAAILAGLAGSIFAHYHHYIAPDFFTFYESVSFISFIIVGGTGNVWGPITGAIVLTIVPEVLELKESRPLFYGGLIMAVVMFLQNGIVDIPNLIQRKIRWR